MYSFLRCSFLFFRAKLEVKSGTRQRARVLERTNLGCLQKGSGSTSKTCIFRTVQSKQCERQDQIYRRIKTKSRKKDGLKVSS
jgi:hypothetical protein